MSGSVCTRIIAGIGCVATALTVAGYRGVGAHAEAHTVPAAQTRLSAGAADQTAPRPEASAGGLRIAIAAQGGTTVRMGGAPIYFTVTVTNTTAHDDLRVRPVVSVGHCSCTPGRNTAPSGSMHMLDRSTTSWRPVIYNGEATGMDFLTRSLVEPFTLKHGQSVTYPLEVQLDPNRDARNGEVLLNAMLGDISDTTRSDATAWLSLTVEK